jgi:hypothetical protein
MEMIGRVIVRSDLRARYVVVRHLGIQISLAGAAVSRRI